MKIFFILTFIFLSSSAKSINEYSYDKSGKYDKTFCKEMYENLGSTDIPNRRYTLNVDLLVEHISNIDPINNYFEAYYSLWVHWKDNSVKEYLKTKNLYNPEKTFYMCSYDSQKAFYEDLILFNPVVEFYENEPVDFKPNWIELFSDGTVQIRKRGSQKFKSWFEFEKFPFDKQTFYFYMYSEYPKSILMFKADEAMDVYKKNLYMDEQEDYYLNIPGWETTNVNFYEESYFDDIDGHKYSGFIVEIDAERKYFWYIFKIMAPIIFILLVSWSVFWLGAKQVESKVTITIVAFLGLIAYNFIISSDVPKLEYLTYMDVFILLAYLFSGLSTMIAIASNAYFRNTDKNINFIDITARYLGIPLYLLLNIINYYYFIGFKI
tara:strand:+ start:81 stop:1217 length:1137 start_codon:yes stop_codon:yes gene_type:complete